VAQFVREIKEVTVSGTSYITAVDSNEGLAVNAGSLGTVIYASGGLQVGASGFGVKLDGASLTLGASGLKVTTPATNYITAIDASEGLEVNAGSLGTVINASGGLQVGASGFGVKLDGASLSLGAGGLSVAQRAYGSLYVSTAVNTVCTTAGTFYKIGGTTTSILLNDFTMPADNRLTYTGTPTITVMVICTAAIDNTTTTANQNCAIQFGVDGSTVAASQSLWSFALGGPGYTTVTTIWVLSMSTNTYIEPFVANLTKSGDTLKADSLKMVAVQIG